MKNLNIGLVLDFRFGEGEDGYSDYPYYAQRENLVAAFSEKANVLLLPHDRSSAVDYINMIDAVVFTGSAYHIDSFYYREPKIGNYTTDNRRADFEFEMLRRGIDKGIPVLGLGGGMQMINVFLGGSMYQNILEEVPGVINHQQNAKGLKWHQPYHDNVIIPNTELARILGTEVIQVNSAHTQAVKRLGEGLKINAISKVDNIIEGIESENQNYWVMGLEWRPEYVYSREKPEEERERLIFEEFMAKALELKDRRKKGR